MKKLLVMDRKNYDPSLKVLQRVAVRGIIFIDGKLLLVETEFGELKLPGGGKEIGESDITTLIREVKEETGYQVIESSIREFGEIEEKRLSTHESMIWNQFSRLYFCDVSLNPSECEYTENEKTYGFHQVLYSLDDAIAKNQALIDKEGEHGWNQREYNTLRLIKQYFFGGVLEE